jgi:transposase
MISKELRDLRDFTRTRLNLVHKRVSCINSIHSLLFKYNCHPNSKSQLSKQIEETGFSNTIPVNHIVRYHIDVFIEQAHLIKQQIEEIEHFIKQEILNVDSEHFRQIIKMPGIGEVLGMTILLEIDDINRFPEAKNLFSYAGLVPGAKNSNKTIKNISSKQRNKYLKHAFKEASVHAIHFFPAVKEFYYFKQKKHNKAQAHTLVAKELARTLFYLMKENMEHPRFKGKYIKKSEAYMNQVMTK